MPAEIDPSASAPSAAVIAENLRRVRERIDAACQRAGRSPDEVTIVGVSKGFSASAVVAAYEAGLSDVGENRVQEAAAKVAAATAQGARPRWHLVGHLQRNKVKTALGLFDIIHSVDSLRLAEAVGREAGAEARARPQRKRRRAHKGGLPSTGDISTGVACPECGSLLVFAEGCLLCRSCGYEKCG